jgi:hypothetical protein
LNPERNEPLSHEDTKRLSTFWRYPANGLVKVEKNEEKNLATDAAPIWHRWGKKYKIF